jgi:isopentenyl-diphosphate delta-isomerase
VTDVADRKPAITTGRENALVVVVDEDGTSVGSCTVTEAHRGQGARHRAFSVLLRDSQGRVLLQRRSEGKTRFAGAWANTCCGHPAPGEDVVGAATRRLTEEMGLRVARLSQAGTFVYRALDQASDYVEHEFDHVLTGWIDEEPTPDPAEVSDWCWLDPLPHDNLPRQLPSPLIGGGARLAPWLAPVMRLASEYWSDPRRRRSCLGGDTHHSCDQH